MVSCDVTLTRLYEQGQSSAIIAWTYIDDSDGSVIAPDTFGTSGLFNPSDVQKDPSDTANASGSNLTITEDTSGAVTGTAGAHYITVNFDNDAEVGVWYVTTQFTWESKTRTQNVCFNLLAAGATVGGGSPSATLPVYAIAQDVENFLMTELSLDANSMPNRAAIEDKIVRAEGDFEKMSGTAFKPIFEEDEVHDIEAFRQRHREFLDSWYITVPRPIQLAHKPVLPFDSSRGHRIEVYEGNDGTPTTADPVPRWADWLATKTQGRDNDWWLDWQKGILYVKKTFLFRRGSAFRISYEWGKPITTTSTAIDSSTATVSVQSTHRYKTRGWVRIGEEYIFHTGKTATAFTGCTRGIFNTQPQSHSQNAEVYEVPDDVRSAIIKKAAAEVLENDTFVAPFGDGGNTAPSFESKIKSWKEEFNKLVETQYQQWGLA